MSEHDNNLLALNKPIIQVCPIITARHFDRSDAHSQLIWFVEQCTRAGNWLGLKCECDHITFVAVKGKSDWALYYMVGICDPGEVAVNGYKATVQQVIRVLDAQDDLISKYRK